MYLYRIPCKIYSRAYIGTYILRVCVYSVRIRVSVYVCERVFFTFVRVHRKRVCVRLRSPSNLCNNNNLRCRRLRRWPAVGIFSEPLRGGAARGGGGGGDS